VPTDSRRPNLIITRHFASKLNERGISRGWMEVGIDQEAAKKIVPGVAATLKKQGIRKLVSSTLPRAEESMKLIGREMGDDIETESTSRLKTWKTGDQVAGKPDKETIPLRQKYIRNSEIEMPGGESWDNFMERYERELKQIAGEDGTALVGHGHHILGASEALTGEKTDPQKLGGLDENFPPGAVFGIWIEGKNIRIERLDKQENKDA